MGFWESLFAEEEEPQESFWEKLFREREEEEDDWRKYAMPQDQLNTDLTGLERLAGAADRASEYRESAESSLVRGMLNAGRRLSNVPTAAVDLAAGVAPGALGDELDFIASNMRRQGLEGDEIRERMVPVPEPETKVERTMQDVLQSTPEMVATIGSGFVNPSLPFAMSAGLSGADAYERTRNLGGGRLKSAAIGGVEGAAIGALERLGLEDAARAMKAVPASSRFELASKMLKNAGVNLGVEGSTELVQEVVSMLGEFAGGRSWEDIKLEAAERLERSAMAGGAAGAAFSPATTYAADRGARHLRDQAAAQMLGEEIAQSKPGPEGPRRRITDYSVDELREIHQRPIDELSDSEKEIRLKTSEGTYLGSRQWWNENKEKYPVIGFADLNNLKPLNDLFSIESGDAAIGAVGEQARETLQNDFKDALGQVAAAASKDIGGRLEAFHLSGDEFVAGADNVDEAVAFYEALNDRIRNSQVELHGKDGKLLGTITGLDLEFSVEAKGENESFKDVWGRTQQKVKDAKAERKQRIKEEHGLDLARGELSPGIRIRLVDDAPQELRERLARYLEGPGPEAVPVQGTEELASFAPTQRPPVVFRPKGWEAPNEAPASITRKGHLYRGMDNKEFQNTIGAGLPIRSRGDYSASSEGTKFAANAADAESYVNFGRSDPRVTGEPTWMVEIVDTGSTQDPQGYYDVREDVPIGRIQRIWKMEDSGGEVVATEMSRTAPEGSDKSNEELDWERLPEIAGTTPGSSAVGADTEVVETPFSRLGFELVEHREGELEETWDQDFADRSIPLDEDAAKAPITHYTVDTPEGEYRIEKLPSGKRFKYQVIAPGGEKIGTEYAALGKNSDKGAYGAIRNRFAEADQGVIDLPDGNLWVKGIAKPFQIVEAPVIGNKELTGHRVIGADGQIGRAVFASREDAKQFLKDYAAGLERGEVVMPGEYEGSPDVFRPEDFKTADEVLQEALSEGITGEDVDSAFASGKKKQSAKDWLSQALRFFVRNTIHDKDEHAFYMGRQGMGDYHFFDRGYHYLYSGNTAKHHVFHTPSVIEPIMVDDKFTGRNMQTVSVAASPTLAQKASKVATEAEPDVQQRIMAHFDRDPVSFKDAIEGLAPTDLVDPDNPQKAGPLAKIWMARRITELLDDPVRTDKGKLRLLDIDEKVAKEFLAFADTMQKEDPEQFERLTRASEKLTQAAVDTVLKPRLQAGLISPQEFVNMVSKGLAWAPMRKAMEEEESYTGYVTKRHRGRGASVLKNLRRGPESGKMLNPIFEAMGMGSQTWRAVAKENLKQMSAKAIDENPKRFAELGIRKLGTQKPGKKLKKNTFAVHVDGKPVYYEVPQGVAEVLEVAGPEWTSAFWGLLETPLARFGLVMPMRVLKTGVTTGLNFIFKNPVKDTVSTFINAGHMGFIPGYDTVMGTIDVMTHGALDRKLNEYRAMVGMPVYEVPEGGYGYEAEVQGASQSTHVDATKGDLELQGVMLQDLLVGERYRDHIREEWKKFKGDVKKGHLAALLRPAQFLMPIRKVKTTEGTDFTTSGWARALEEFSSLAEKGNRAGVMRRGMRGKVWDRTQTTPLSELVGEVREGPGVDFRRAGAAGRLINAFGEEFYNPSMQDVDKVYRMLANEKTRAGYMGRIGLAIGAPAALNMVANVFTDDEERRQAYERRPEYEKALYFHWGYNREDGSFSTLPRIPGFWSVIQYAAERSMRGLAGQGYDSWSDIKTAMENNLPVEYLREPQDLVIPPVWEARSEVRNNRDKFRDRPVVPQNLERLQLEDQYTERTNPLFRTAAELYNPVARSVPLMEPISPMGVEHIYNKSTGTTGQLVARTAANAARTAGLYENMPNVERGEHEGVSVLPSPITSAKRFSSGDIQGGVSAMLPGQAFGKKPALGWNSQPVSDLYDISERVAAASNSMKKAKGDRERKQEIRSQFKYNPRIMAPAFERSKKKLRELGEQQRKIIDNDALSEEQKTKRLRELDLKVTQEAEKILKRYGFYE